MIKSTQSQIVNRVKSAIDNSSEVTIKFFVKSTAKNLAKSIRNAIATSTVVNLEASILKNVDAINIRQYDGVITSMDEKGLCKIKLENGDYKSLYVNKLVQLHVDGFVYSK